MVTGSLNVLIIDNEPNICDLLEEELVEQGYSCTAVPTAERALALLSAESFDIVLADIRLPGKSGIELLRQIRNAGIDSVVIMITAIGEIDLVIEAMKLGASDYILKPFDLKAVAASVARVRDQVLQKRGTGAGNSLLGYGAMGITVEVARRLGIPEPEIESWVAKRSPSASHKVETVAFSAESRHTLLAENTMNMIELLLLDRTLPENKS